MACPECGEYDRQYFHRGHAATTTTPAEQAGFECAYCNHFYEDDPGNAVDYFYELEKNRRET
jgi:rubredoxin